MEIPYVKPKLHRDQAGWLVFMAVGDTLISRRMTKRGWKQTHVKSPSALSMFTEQRLYLYDVSEVWDASRWEKTGLCVRHKSHGWDICNNLLSDHQRGVISVHGSRERKRWRGGIVCLYLHCLHPLVKDDLIAIRWAINGVEFQYFKSQCSQCLRIAKAKIAFVTRAFSAMFVFCSEWNAIKRKNIHTPSS